MWVEWIVVDTTDCSLPMLSFTVEAKSQNVTFWDPTRREFWTLVRFYTFLDLGGQRNAEALDRPAFRLLGWANRLVGQEQQWAEVVFQWRHCTGGCKGLLKEWPISLGPNFLFQPLLKSLHLPGRAIVGAILEIQDGTPSSRILECFINTYSLILNSFLLKLLTVSSVHHRML